MNSRQIAALRFVSLAIVALVLLGCSDFGGKASVDRPDVETNSSGIMADQEAAGSVCWTSPEGHPASLTDRDPRMVVTEDGLVQKPRVIRKAMENWYANAGHDLVVYGFCD